MHRGVHVASPPSLPISSFAQSRRIPRSVNPFSSLSVFEFRVFEQDLIVKWEFVWNSEGPPSRLGGGKEERYWVAEMRSPVVPGWPVREGEGWLFLPTLGRGNLYLKLRVEDTCLFVFSR